MAAKSPAPPPLSPLLALTIGLVILLVSAGLSSLSGVPLLREVTLFAGSALILIAVVTRLQTAGWEWRDRVETAAYVSSASAIAAGMVLGGINPAWGSTRLLFSAASLFGFGTTALILLPTVPRKILLSIWIIFHFGGMFTSYASIDPPGNQGPYLAKHLYTFVYRPYLSFLYMTNAYHFYSPDPGAPNLLWFAVHYSDGSYLWIRLPTREKGQIGMHYQRVLALPEHSFSPSPLFPLTDQQARDARRQGVEYNEDRVWENILERRLHGSRIKFPLVVNGKAEAMPIPWPADLGFDMQYREPNETSKLLIRSVAMRVMHVAPQRKGLQVRSVKAYRVTQQILTTFELANGGSPHLKPKHWPYFLGEFDTAGDLVNPLDPFLYWYIPILHVPINYPGPGYLDPQNKVSVLPVRVPAPKKFFELDGLEMHAAGPVGGNQ